MPLHKQSDGGIKVALGVWGHSWEEERIIPDGDIIRKL